MFCLSLAFLLSLPPPPLLSFPLFPYLSFLVSVGVYLLATDVQLLFFSLPCPSPLPPLPPQTHTPQHGMIPLCGAQLHKTVDIEGQPLTADLKSGRGEDLLAFRYVKHSSFTREVAHVMFVCMSFCFFSGDVKYFYLPGIHVAEK